MADNSVTLNDGGPAFPRPIGNNGSNDWHNRTANCEQEGMKLRDYFAGKALNHLSLDVVDRLADPDGPLHDEIRNEKGVCDYVVPAVVIGQRIAKAAYLIADAMIAERERTR
jgi:hypothetical protein